MSFVTAKLADVAPAKALKKKVVDASDLIWHLNLDQVESQTGRVITEQIAPVSEAGNSTHWFDERHVLYSKLRPYLNKVVVPEKEGIATTELVPMLPDPDRLDRMYLAYYLRSSQFVNWISAQVAGAKMPRVSMKVFWEHEIPLPPLAEQKRIAAILDKADALRRKRQQAIDLADQFLRSVFLEMFGDPVTNPKGWVMVPFGELGKWASGGTPSRAEKAYFEGEIDWYSAGELNTRYVPSSKEKISERAIKESAAKLFPAGSMLLGMYDTAAFKASILCSESSSNQACACVIPNEKLNIEWFYTFIQLSKEHYLCQRRGVRQKNLNLGMIKEFTLPLPPIEKQDKFARMVTACVSLLARCETGTNDLERLFSSIGQQAFRGEL